jgi:hypothetical protein
LCPSGVHWTPGTPPLLFLPPTSTIFLSPSCLLLHHPLSSLFTPAPYLMPTICAGSQKDTNSCGCSLFIPKKSKENRCKTCRHQRVSHSDIPTTPPQDDNTITAVTKKDRSKYINRLFKSLEATAVHDNARKETLKGFRPPSPPTVVRVASTLHITFTNLYHSCHATSLSHSPRKGRGKRDRRLAESSPRPQPPAQRSLAG